MLVTIVGGGMITRDQLLPSLYHLQRSGVVGEITICASRPGSVQALASDPQILAAFPGQSFRALPDSGEPQPELYREVIRRMPPRQIVVVAVPDPLHFDVILAALEADQHVLAVKPFVLEHRQAVRLEREAKERNLVVGIEYHKRFDDRSLMARRNYRSGLHGEFRLGTACLMEKWYYRHSNFQNWCDNAFTYIGCHYVDLVHFITGLLPARVSVYGVADRYPNGREGYLWTDARVIWSNGACLNVQNSLGFPDEAPGTNTQGLTLYCRTADGGGLLSHSDQYRGLKYSGVNGYTEPSPDYFQYVDLGGPGLVPVGYGYRSVEHIVKKCIEVEAAAPESRPQLLRAIDEAGIMATPANSSYNELVIEAGHVSIQNGGREVSIDYGDTPKVRLS
jgi:D-galacturonate reductase